MSEVTDAKALNNDWSSESTIWGNGFRVDIETEGNEADGEVPHTNADIALGNYLRSDDNDFTGNGRPESADGVTVEARVTQKWAVSGVTMTLALAGEQDVINGEFDGLREAIAESLPDEWEEVN
jgi:hypothetical protein